MQLHRLEMTAIGPFAGTETIDFARVGRAGLFLLEGPTGSGKSTIIDAITFALYGRVAQACADVERIHSHHAAPDTVPVVTLVFETQAGLFRVRRTPRFERPKKHGNGLTVQQPSVKLWRIGSPDDLTGGDLLSTNIGDCDDEITRAVGLTRDQFVQTVILPQGEFATFLRARSEEKGKLLEKVFGTAFFRRVQESVVEAGRAAAARRADAVDEIRSAIHAFAVCAGLDEAARDALVTTAQTEPDALAGELDQVVDELATRERHARKASREAIERHRQMADMVGDATLRMQRRERLLELQRQDETLGGRAVEMKALRARVELARQAHPVAGAVRTLATSTAAAKQADAALARARSRVAADLREGDAPTLREALTACRETIGALSAAAETEAALVRLRQQRVEQADALGACTDRVSTVSAELGRLPGARAETQQQLSEAERLVALLDVRTEEAQRAGRRLEAALAHAAAAAALPGLERQATAALEEVQGAERSLARLRQARIDAIAGELGLALAPDEPCPVCGSLQHPSPARPSDGAVTPEQVAAEEARVAALHEAARVRTEALGRARVRERELAARAEGLDVDDARRAVEAAATRLTESGAAAAAAEQLTATLGLLRDREDELAAQAGRLRDECTRLGQAIADLDSRIAADGAAVLEARAGFESVAARRDSLAEEAGRLAELLDALAQAEATRRAVHDDEAVLASDLSLAGFASLEEWAQARQSSEWIAEQSRAIGEFEAECIKVKAGLSGPELADVQLDALFDDLPQLRALAGAAKADLERATSEHGSLRDQLARTRSRVADITEALTHTAGVMRETADAVRVGQLVAGGGDNQLNLDLAKYVLIRRFTEVLSAANAELSRFSGGRYTLEHTDEKQGNAKSGLGVRVHDLHTNQVREVGTLSGGETFYVSLSLALALAEVVRAESGGVELGTLFVDEGFGTLDPDVLDDVLKTLEGLREGGRTVGIVSHVSELKSRVADRVEVVVRPDRTSTLRVTA
ncbi:MAG TPA: SMC family ATPase [Intrasporangium sp.]|uniref:SMC family ATPase n=1 Tax=Intrasporangium sp. TaxID=1925024 RepID=UPI002D79A521|nr:SMC family ATPase [Intrasporangium sp.]HET7397409.1 SMC family ATPase [Intrasporangium sp.]